MASKWSGVGVVSSDPSSASLPGFLGKRVFVSGGTSGIGRAVVELLGASGASVFTVARDQNRLDARLETWRSELNFEVAGTAMDVTNPDSRTKLFEELSSKWGALDACVLNVGTNIRKQALDYTPEEAEFVFDTNQRSAFALAMGVQPLLMKGDQAAMAFVLSVAAHTHIPTGAPYAMTKAALEQLVRNLAVEWAPSIRVNAVSPWYTRTPLVRSVLEDAAYEQRVLAATPMGRIATPEEVAAPIGFLVSPLASYITGQTLPVDGGFLAKGF